MELTNILISFFHDRKIRVKFILAFATVAIPMLAMAWFSYGILEQEISEKISRTTSFTLEQIKLSIESRLDEMMNYCNYLSLNNKARDLIELSDNNLAASERLNVSRGIDDIFFSVGATFLQNTLYAVVYDIDGPEYISWNLYNPAINDLRKSNWFNDISNKRYDYIEWIGLHKNYFEASENSKYVISIARTMKDRNDVKNIGIIVVSIPEKRLSGYLNGNSIYGNTKRYILDENNTIISSSTEDLIGQKLEIPVNGLIGDSIILDNQRFLLNIMPLKYMQWSLAELIPYNEVSSELSTKKIVFLEIMALSFLGFILLSYVISNSLSKRLCKLQKAIGEVEAGKLSVSVEDNACDEIGSLSGAFNKMVTRLKALLEQIYNEQSMRREAELKMLRAQINPHFLFNTLNSIKMAASMSRADNVAQMISALGELLISTFKDKDECIALSKELENIRSYAYLQKVRFNNRFEFLIEVNEKHLSLKVIKFMLQPIVENSIIHGFDKKGIGGLVRIRSGVRNNSLFLHVIDNGKGIDTDKLKNLFSSEEKESIGLVNVERRIKLVFGSKYGIRIKSKPDAGTVVSIKLPVEKL